MYVFTPLINMIALIQIWTVSKRFVCVREGELLEVDFRVAGPESAGTEYCRVKTLAVTVDGPVGLHVEGLHILLGAVFGAGSRGLEGADVGERFVEVDFAEGEAAGGELELRR